MSKLVIAEKPMLARDIARAITGKEVSESARLPISGKELLAGEKHLFERHTLEALKEKLDGHDLHFETTVSK